MPTGRRRNKVSCGDEGALPPHPPSLALGGLVSSKSATRARSQHASHLQQSAKERDTSLRHDRPSGLRSKRSRESLGRRAIFQEEPEQMPGPRARIRKVGRSGGLNPSRMEHVNSTSEIFV